MRTGSIRLTETVMHVLEERRGSESPPLPSRVVPVLALCVTKAWVVGQKGEHLAGRDRAESVIREAPGRRVCRSV